MDVGAGASTSGALNVAQQQAAEVVVVAAKGAEQPFLQEVVEA